MDSMENMSLKQIRENAERLQRQQAEAKATMDSIMSVVGDNKLAIVSLCQRKDFGEVCRKTFGLSDSADVAEYIRGRLFKEEAKATVPTIIQQDYVTDVIKKRAASYSSGGNTGGVIPKSHMLRIKDGLLTGEGVLVSGSDGDWVRYTWLTSSEYIQLFERTCELSKKRKQGSVNYGVVGVRFKYANGSTVDFVHRNDCYEIAVAQLSASTCEVKPYSQVVLFRSLMDSLYDTFGDKVSQLLGEMMMDSYMGRNGVSPVYSQIFSPMSSLKKAKVDFSARYKFIKMPGVFDNNGIKDIVYINNANLMFIKGQSRSNSEVYYDFNNESFYVRLFRQLAATLYDRPEEEVYKLLDERVQFLIRPFQ